MRWCGAIPGHRCRISGRKYTISPCMHGIVICDGNSRERAVPSPESPSTTAVMSFPSLYMGIPIFQPLYVTLAPCPRQRPHSCELFRPSHRLHAYKSSVPSASSVSSANLRKKRQMDASNRPFLRKDRFTYMGTNTCNQLSPFTQRFPFAEDRVQDGTQKAQRRPLRPPLRLTVSVVG